MQLPRRILVIGGGPCGLVTLRNLLRRGDFDDIQLVERRDNIGGIWYHPLHQHLEANHRWPLPAYPGLIGNVIPEFLSFSGDPFPAPLGKDQPFPTLCETYDYLAAFARPLFDSGRIRFQHEVVDAAEVPAEEGGGWRVVMIDWSQGNGNGVRKEERWDAIVVTTVWYDNAHYPAVEGLDDIQKTGCVRHAQTWRGPGDYKGKRVIVIGNANSANDMAAQLAPVAQLPVYRSIRRPSIFPFLPDDRIEDVGPALRYTRSADKVAVHLHDRIIDNVDVVLFGTGYYPEVPYLRVLEPVAPTAEYALTQRPTVRALVPLTGRHVHPARIPLLYRHVLYAHNTSLAFIGALISFIPFAMADLTSSWLALAWSPRCGGGDGGGQNGMGTGTETRVAVPPTVDGRLADERDRLKTLHQLRSETSDPSDLVPFHVLAQHELPYAQCVRAEIVEAAPELGEVLAPWDEQQDARRLAMHGTKLDSLYAMAGRERRDP